MSRLITVSIALVAITALTARSQPYHFSPPIDYPGATDTANPSISDDGRIVGQFNVGDSTSGFLYHQSIFTEMEAPEPSEPGNLVIAIPGDINALGQIAGGYSEGLTGHGFLYSGGNFQILDHPDAERGPGFAGINNSGHIVGSYYTIDSNELRYHGTLYDGASFHPIEYPRAKRTFANGISNSGLIVGSYSSGITVEENGFLFLDEQGFMFDGTDYHLIEYPGALRTIASGVNSRGWIVGTYILADNTGARGFLLRDGVYKSIEYPDSNNTTNLNDINDSGVIVGTFQTPDGFGPHHAFTMTIPEPSSVLLAALGLVGLAARWLSGSRVQRMENKLPI